MDLRLISICWINIFYLGVYGITVPREETISESPTQLQQFLTRENNTNETLTEPDLALVIQWPARIIPAKFTAVCLFLYVWGVNAVTGLLVYHGMGLLARLDDCLTVASGWRIRPAKTPVRMTSRHILYQNRYHSGAPARHQLHTAVWVQTCPLSQANVSNNIKQSDSGKRGGCCCYGKRKTHSHINMVNGDARPDAPPPGVLRSPYSQQSTTRPYPCPPCPPCPPSSTVSGPNSQTIQTQSQPMYNTQQLTTSSTSHSSSKPSTIPPQPYYSNVQPQFQPMYNAQSHITSKPLQSAPKTITTPPQHEPMYNVQPTFTPSSHSSNPTIIPPQPYYPPIQPQHHPTYNAQPPISTSPTHSASKSITLPPKPEYQPIQPQPQPMYNTQPPISPPTSHSSIKPTAPPPKPYYQPIQPYPLQMNQTQPLSTWNAPRPAPSSSQQHIPDLDAESVKESGCCSNKKKINKGNIHPQIHGYKVIQGIKVKGRNNQESIQIPEDSYMLTR